MAESTKMISIKTSRLRLRPLKESDLAAFAAYRSDPEVARYQGWSAPYSMEQAESFLEEMSRARPGTPGTWFQLAIERQAQPGIIGDCAFQVLANDERQAQIGFTLARPFQKQGYAAEAVAGLLDFLFAEYSLHRISAVCDALNTASARLLERVGMRREGQYIENVWFKGAWGDEYFYAVLEREWRQMRDRERSGSRPAD
jgi:aminoglycoside 6'-N-acetyltransferase